MCVDPDKYNVDYNLKCFASSSVGVKAENIPWTEQLTMMGQ